MSDKPTISNAMKEALGNVAVTVAFHPLLGGQHMTPIERAAFWLQTCMALDNTQVPKDTAFRFAMVLDLIEGHFTLGDLLENKCPRCNGVITAEHTEHIEEGVEVIKIVCENCGDIIETTALQPESKKRGCEKDTPAHEWNKHLEGD